MDKEQQQINEVVQRIKEMRDICGFTVAQMAEKTEITEKQYLEYESGKVDLPFTFVHKCALAFNIGLADLLEGQSARLSTYTVTRRNGGLTTAREDGNEPGKRSGIGQFVQGVTNNIGDLINNVFSIDNKPSYLVFYLEKNATLHIGYDNDGKRSNNKEDLVFLYSVYGGDGTTVVLHDGVTVLGEIICDHLIIEGDAQLIYTSTSGSQIAKQKIAEYWAVSNYSD